MPWGDRSFLFLSRPLLHLWSRVQVLSSTLFLAASRNVHRKFKAFIQAKLFYADVIFFTLKSFPSTYNRPPPWSSCPQTLIIRIVSQVLPVRKAEKTSGATRLAKHRAIVHVSPGGGGREQKIYIFLNGGLFAPFFFIWRKYHPLFLYISENASGFSFPPKMCMRLAGRSQRIVLYLGFCCLVWLANENNCNGRNLCHDTRTWFLLSWRAWPVRQAEYYVRE